MTDDPTETPVEAEEKSSDSVAKRAGRGLVSIAGAKVFFICTSYAIQLLLPRILGAERYGLYSAAMSGVSILNNVLIAATIQSVSKFVSEEESAAPAILRKSLKIQLLIGGVLSAALFSFAEPLAHYLNDPKLTFLFQIASLVVLAYSLYAAMVGTLNGARQFQKQAGLDVTFSSLRSVGIIGGSALLGMGAAGAMSGFAAAAMVITGIAFWVVRPKGDSTKAAPLLPAWLAFMAPIWLYQGFLNGVLQIDLQVMKKLVAEVAGQSMNAEAAASIASTHVAYYRGAQMFAFVPYQLILSMTFIVFPMVSRATSTDDEALARSTIKNAMRFSLLVLLAIAAPISGAADGVLRIVFPEEFMVGSVALSILAFGMVAFALFVIAATVLSSSGRPGWAAGIAGIALVAVVLLNSIMIRNVGVTPNFDALGAAAQATSLGMLLALVCAATAVFYRFRTFIGMLTAFRAAIAGGVAFTTAHFVPHDTRIMAIVALAAGFFAFLIVLVLTREIAKDDLNAVRKIVGR